MQNKMRKKHNTNHLLLNHFPSFIHSFACFSICSSTPFICFHYHKWFIGQIETISKLVIKATNPLYFSFVSNVVTAATNLVVPGAKRGRQLIRQSRIKKDVDPSQMSPSPDDIEFEVGRMSPYSQRLSVSGAIPSTHKPTIERHVSEPTPRLSSQSPPIPSATVSTMHLLTVPHVLTKQHSAPSQSICDTQFSYHRPEPHSHFSLHRQLSLPSAHSPPHPERGDPFATVAAVAAAAAAIEKDPMSASHPSVRSSMNTDSSAAESSKSIAHDLSPTFVVVAEPIDQSAASQPPPPASSSLSSSSQPMRVREELQRSVSTPQVCYLHIQSYRRFYFYHGFCCLMLFSHFCLQHLMREISLENRSQHCPVIRPGPALGCNFCWNTIDAHGRILRRKTKYHCPECQTNLCIVPCFQEYHERQSTNEPSTSSSSSSNETTKNLSTASGLRHHPKSSSLP